MIQPLLRFRLTLLFCFSFGFLGAQTTILQEDFQGGSMPSEWAQMNPAGDGGWLYGDASSLESSYYSIPSHTNFMATNDDDTTSCGGQCNKNDERLLTDTMDFSGYSSVVMTFDAYFLEGSYNNNTESFDVMVSPDNGNTWNVVKSISGSGEWVTKGVDLSAYTGNSQVIVAFRYSDDGGWLYGCSIDNVHIYEPLEPNLEMTALDVQKYVAAGNNINVSGTFTNIGGNDVSSATLKWQADGGTVHSESLSSLGLSPFDSHQFTHQDQLNMSSVTAKSLTVWVEAPNGNTDMDQSDDTLAKDVASLSSIPTKKVLLEEATGAWCGYCPDGAVRMENTLDNNPNTLGVSLHNGDPMEVPDGATVLSTFIGGYPGGMVDRYLFESETSIDLSRTTWDSYAGTREGHRVPADLDLNVSYNTNTREISVDVTSNFYGPPALDEGLRLNAYIVEDHVSDSNDSGYDQTNYYNNESGHPYEGAGDPIVGYDHRHVLRAMLGGPWGTSGVIPNSGVTDGDSYTKTYTHTLPSDQKAKDIAVIGVLQKYDSNTDKRSILNVESDSSVMRSVASLEDQEAGSASMDIYPNPVTDRAKLDIRVDERLEGRIEVRDMMGRLVMQEKAVEVRPGASYLPIDMSGEESGMYTVSFITEQGNFSERFSVVDR